MIAGVAAGVGHTLGVDPVVIRLLFVVFTLAGGSGILVYLLGWILIPEADGRGGTGGSSSGQAGTATAALFGGVLVLAGSWILIDRYVPEIGRVVGQVFWPLLLIALGVALLVRRS